MNQSSFSPATAAEVLAVDVIEGRVAPDDCDCKVEFARRGREADFVVARLKAHAHSNVRHALRVVSRHGDVEPCDGAAFVNGKLLFWRVLTEAKRSDFARREHDGRDPQAAWRFDL